VFKHTAVHPVFTGQLSRYTTDLCSWCDTAQYWVGTFLEDEDEYVRYNWAICAIGQLCCSYNGSLILILTITLLLTLNLTLLLAQTLKITLHELYLCSTLDIGHAYGGTYYHLNGTELLQSSVCRNLGVTITSDSSASQHIIENSNQGPSKSQTYNLLFFISGNTHLLVTAFIVCMRSLLEYVCHMNLSLIKDIDLTEQVQRWFNKRMRSFIDIYWEVATS